MILSIPSDYTVYCTIISIVNIFTSQCFGVCKQHLLIASHLFNMLLCTTTQTNQTCDLVLSPGRYVSLSDNEKTGYKARELKSVHVDAIGTYLRVTLHRNHANRYNYYSQVDPSSPRLPPPPPLPRER